MISNKIGDMVALNVSMFYLVRELRCDENGRFFVYNIEPKDYIIKIHKENHKNPRQIKMYIENPKIYNTKSYTDEYNGATAYYPSKYYTEDGINYNVYIETKDRDYNKDVESINIIRNI